MPAASRFTAFLLLLLVAGLLLFGRLRSPLLEPEEAVYAEVPREMTAAGNWVVPLRQGRAYYEKPPLLYWLIMASYASFGVHDWAARLIPCAAALGIILVTFLWGNRTFGFRAGLAGALILCLSPRFVHQARMITMDGLLCFWVLCAMALGQKAIQPPAGASPRSRFGWVWWLLSAVACGFGVLTKGPLALALVAVPILTYQVLDRRTARPRGRYWLAYLGTAMGLALPWYLTLAWQDPAFVREFFWIHHVVMRFLQPLHEEPAWFYLPVLLIGMLPWTLLVPALIKLLIRRSGPAAQERPAELGFLLLCCLWCFIFFSAADCKRIGYILPAMPPLALILGYTLHVRLPGQSITDWGFHLWSRGTAVSYWATQGIFAVAIVSALLASFTGLVKPVPALAMISLATAGIGWTVYRNRRLTPSGSWVACGFSTFALLFMAVHFLLPAYYRKFSMRAQIRSVVDDSYSQKVPVVCYPHHWDSISFYLGRHDLHTYGPDNRDRMIADLQSWPETLIFVKSGPALDDLLHALPSSLEFVPRGQSRWVTAGVVHMRTSAGNYHPQELSLKQNEVAGERRPNH